MNAVESFFVIPLLPKKNNNCPGYRSLLFWKNYSFTKITCSSREPIRAGERKMSHILGLLYNIIMQYNLQLPQPDQLLHLTRPGED